MAATARPLGPRAIPNGPQYPNPYESAWYEADQRLAPSYIAPPPQSPPSPADVRMDSYPFPAAQSPQGRAGVPPSPSKLPPGAARPYHQVSNAPQRPSSMSGPTPLPQRPAAQQGRRLSHQGPADNGLQRQQSPLAARPPLRPSHFQSFPTPETRYAPGQSGRTTANGKGSAFMHKGFFDLMQLANDRGNTAGASKFLGSMQDDHRPTSPSKFRSTLSKATAGIRGPSNKVGPPPSAAAASISPDGSPPAAQSSLAALPGVKATKKRINVGQISAPRPSSFVHAAHASDAEQAEALLNRWGRDGVGKVADPIWVERTKEALKMQAARNQAEAIAQVQAAMHQDSYLINQPRALQIMNGLPSNFTASSVPTINSLAPTMGHSVSSGSQQTLHGMPTTSAPNTPGVGGFVNQFKGIAEEGRSGGSDEPTVEESRDTLEVPQIARPTLPRTNTAGTTILNRTPSPNGQADGEAQDYLSYRNPQAAAAPISIDGLPGGGERGTGGLNKMFESLTTNPAARPTSMLVRDSYLDGSDLSAHMAAEMDNLALRPSLTTVEKSVAAKIYFENLYYGILKKPAARDTRRAGLEKELAGLRIPESSKEAIRSAWTARETEYLRDVRARVSANSFAKLKTIGHGAFGVVALVREKGSGQLFAMKQLRKADMLRKGQEGHVRAERDLMTSASASGSRRWIVNLVYSFQDTDHLYLIMEFMGGGDLLNLLIEKDIFPEDFSRFYVAEMILAIHEAHRLGYIHRDIKPDNFLFTSQGHIKLADFGLCQSFHWAHDGAYYDQHRRNLLKKHGIDLEDAGAGRRTRANGAAGGGPQRDEAGRPLDDRELREIMSDRNPDGTPHTHVLTWREKNKKKIAYSVVGTNNYMAPEVLRGLGYDQSCDWWSLGCIVFEMLYGYPPFVSKSRHLTRQKILNWRQTLRFPPKPRGISREAQDFILRLVCEREDRLGSTSTASVSRPNSVLQNARQQSGFAPPGAGAGGAGGLADGVEELMSHPWFKGIDWDELHRTTKPPFRPALAHAADTRHFEDDIADEPLAAPGALTAAENGGVPPPPDPARDPMLRDKAHGGRLLEMRKQLAFVGYTFKRPPGFDPRDIDGEVAASAQANGQSARALAQAMGAPEGGSHIRSMSM
ncbi:kinase-like protein [Jaminaea rosea]|uniref:non-specific serine/threonine protein kinase n=1 Tax=Jaminaea rosea TaxID=1569628 RepID=A0A316US74_9BASI|nr:kinase-like protein [Jaminaea rosea]PWN28132.1 kinase-like protein [Jaminaea rosea]